MLGDTTRTMDRLARFEQKECAWATRPPSAPPLWSSAFRSRYNPTLLSIHAASARRVLLFGCCISKALRDPFDALSSQQLTRQPRYRKRGIEDPKRRVAKGWGKGAPSNPQLILVLIVPCTTTTRVYHDGGYSVIKSGGRVEIATTPRVAESCDSYLTPLPSGASSYWHWIHT